MGELNGEPAHSPEPGVSPFGWFGVALFVGAIWAVVMGVEYANTPTFTSAALPTILGVSIAVGAYLFIGWRAPANE